MSVFESFFCEQDIASYWIVAMLVHTILISYIHVYDNKYVRSLKSQTLISSLEYVKSKVAFPFRNEKLLSETPH